MNPNHPQGRNAPIDRRETALDALSETGASVDGSPSQQNLVRLDALSETGAPVDGSPARENLAYARSIDSAPVTVVLLACDRPEWTQRAIDSVLQQSFTDFVLLVSDDSKDDRTKAVVEALNDDRITWIKGPRKGQLANVNFSLHQVKTPFVAILHDDDWWASNLLETLLPPMLTGDQNGPIDAAFCELRAFDKHEQPLPHISSLIRANRSRAGLRTGNNPLNDPETTFALLVVDQVMSPFQGTVLRTSLLQLPFPDEVGTLGDYWISILLERSAKAIFYTDATWCAYRIHGNSEAAERKDFPHEKWTLEQALNDVPSAAMKVRLLHRFDRVLYAECRSQIQVANYSEARKHVRSIGTGISRTRRWALPFLCNPVGRAFFIRRERATNIRFR